MLSTEKPSSSLKDRNSSDERPSQELVLPDESQQSEVDLLSKPKPKPKPPLDHHQTPLPNFNIRDYVFSARRKDIKTNWPFSSRSLQLCLKHGVKNLLPPFKALGTARNQPYSCEVGTSSSETVKSGNSLDKAADKVFLNSPENDKLSEDVVGSCKAAGENEKSNTRTTVSQPEVEPPLNQKQTRPPVDLLECSTEVEVAAIGLRSSRKTDNSTRAPSKKNKLVVRLGGNPDRSSSENIGSSSTTISETMASKVCPVCKTFSSSSNTTLNAHIDQCLSGDSTPKWSIDSKLPRHKHKARKIKLMGDIYATTKPCTLEELERRNGRIWASVSSLPPDDTEKSVEREKHTVSPVQNENTGEVGAVYIDSSGTKVRILSKLNDAPSSSKVAEDLGPRKPLSEGKGTKFQSTKKKKKHAQKHQKYLRVATQSKKNCSHMTSNSQVLGVQEKFSGAEGSTRDKANNSRLQQSVELGTLRQWVCSKRTGLTKKANMRSGQESSRRNLHESQELLNEGDQSQVAFINRNYNQKSSNMPEKATCASHNGDELASSVRDTQASDREEQPLRTMGTGNSFSSARVSDGIITSLSPLKRKALQYSKERATFGDKGIFKPPNPTGNHVIGPETKRDANTARPSDNPNVFHGARLKATRTNSMAMNDTEASTLRKKFPSASWSSSFKVKSNGIMKSLPLKKSRVNCTADLDGTVAWNSRADEQNNFRTSNHGNQSERENITGNASLGSNSAVEFSEGKAADISWREEATVSRGQLPECRRRDGNKATVSTVGVDGILRKYGDSESHRTGYRVRRDDIVHEPSSEVAAQYTRCLCKSSGCKHHRPETRSNFQISIDNNKGPFYEAPECNTDVQLDEREMFSPDDVDSLGQPNARVAEELDPEVELGHSFPQVDPIPIPGPPGSFLPSPGRHGSEEFQGNSSLTTSRGQSSQDHYDAIDRDSSESPISAASTVSNSMGGGSGANCSDNLNSVRSATVHDNANLGFSCCTTDASPQNGARVPQWASVGMEKIIYEGENYKFHGMPAEKGNLGYRNDDMPCCCQRKERTPQNLALNCQEQLLRRQAVASLDVPTFENQLSHDSDTEAKNVEAMPNMVQPRSQPSPGSDKVFLPVTKAATDVASLKGLTDASIEFSGCGHSEPSIQSVSSPVLRLMGKNLMVVNKDEDKSRSLGLVHTSSQNSNLVARYPTFSGAPPSFIHNQGQNSFPRMFPVGSVVSCQDPHGTIKQCSDVGFASSFRSQIDMRELGTSGQPSAGVLENQLTSGSFTALLEPYNYKGGRSLTVDPNRQHKRLNATSRYGTENASMKSDVRIKNGDSVAKLKEIIIIDDGPEDEAARANSIVRNTGGLRDTQVVSSGISMPAPHYIRQVNTLPYNHPHDSSARGDSPILHNPSFRPTSTMQAASQGKWGYNSEGAGVFQRSPFVAVSSSPGHLRPAFYYPSRLP